MKSEEYVIANLPMIVEGERLCEAINHVAGFQPFKSQSGREAICRIIEDKAKGNATEMKSDYSRIPGIDKVIYVDENELAASCFGSTEDGGYVFATFSNIEDAILLVYMDKDGKKSYFSGDYVDYLLKFALWMAFSLASLPYKTVPLHASTILYKDKAILFLGESGTGKSTHTRLWRENIPDARMLNDDSPLVRITEQGAMAFGSPWSGKMHCYINDGFPIAACVRLSQAPANKLIKLNIPQAFAALHPSCPPPFAYVDSLYDQISDFLSDLLSDVPVYHLEALPNADAALLVRKTIFG